mgnify:CR=1 FL=1
MRVPAAPKGLSAEARKLWAKILGELGEWEESQLWIVRTGLEQWDEMQAAKAQIKTDGRLVQDRFGQWKAHPLLSVFRDNANGVRQTYKLLGMDMEEVSE